jgi:hypothetical protein
MNQSAFAPENRTAAPLHGFRGDQPSELSRRSSQRSFAQIGKPRFDHRKGKDGVHFDIQLRDDLLG